MLALFVHIIHRIIVYITLFGFILPKKYLKYHLFMWPTILLHWVTNNNRCFLTDLEIKLSGSAWKESEFGVKIARSLGFNIKEKTSKNLTKIYTTFYAISWFISLYRYIYT